MTTLEFYLPLLAVFGIAGIVALIGALCLCKCWRKCKDGHYEIRT